jgi:Tol biopolymer transport system component/C-terminal processing protease CtpA/Prc
MRSLALSPDGKRLAFTYRGDVWVVPSEGGKAEPLTDNLEMNSNAVWSPDGQWIAFSTGRFGGTQTMIVPADGGETQRLTYYPGGEGPSDWSPDGKGILTVTSREDTYPGFYLIDVRTTQAKQLMRDNVGVGGAAYSPDGSKIAFTRMGFPWWRPRYQGSGASQLWVLDVATGKRTTLRNNGFQHLWPHFGSDGKTIYVITVAEKTPSSSPLGHPIPKIVDNAKLTPNVYAVDMSGNARQITEFVGGEVRFLTAARTVPLIAYEYDGDAYLQIPGQKPRKLQIIVNKDDKTANEERLIFTDGASQPCLSHDGQTMSFVVRDDIWTVPVKKGKGPNANDAAQLTNWPGFDEEPLLTPDGKSMFFTSDREGSQRLYKMDLATKAVTPVSKVDNDVSNLQLTPDKQYVSYWLAGKSGGLFVVPVAGGDPKMVVDFNWGSDYSWSPDGRWVAYMKHVGSGPWDVYVNNVVENKTLKLTALNVDNGAPAWSADGKYLYFRSNRDGDGLYMIPLKVEDARPVDLELTYTKPTGAVKVEIDGADVEDRIRKIGSTGVAGNIVADPVTGDVYYIGNDRDIWKTSYNGESTNKVSNGGNISTFSFTDDYSGLYYEQNGNLFIQTLRPPSPMPAVPAVVIPGVTTLKSDLTDDSQRRRRPAPPTAAPAGAAAPLPPGIQQVQFRCDWIHDIAAEHHAAFVQFWKAYNRGFYDPNFHGRDWVAIRKRYEPLLSSVGHRSEMATLLNEMVGELESSHSEVGSAPGGPGGQDLAHLGVAFDYSYAGPGIKIKEVPPNTPGSYAKTKLNPGEYIMSINGTDVRLDEALYRDVLIKQAGRDLTLVVNSKPSKDGAREVKYRALSGGEFGGILHKNRIEKRRKYVEEKSGGKITYVHIDGMGGDNFDQFQREIWEYIQGKQAAIIDVRENGGGNISDQLVNVLERVPHSYYVDRDGEAVLSPGESWNRPTVVMCAESSYSNAEMFPYAMKQRGLASLVGMPTPGYVIWTGGLRLVDGTNARMPGAGVYRLNGISLECNGVQPDYKVPITREQYFAGEDPQLDKAIEVLMAKVK